MWQQTLYVEFFHKHLICQQRGSAELIKFGLIVRTINLVCGTSRKWWHYYMFILGYVNNGHRFYI